MVIRNFILCLSLLLNLQWNNILIFHFMANTYWRKVKKHKKKIIFFLNLNNKNKEFTSNLHYFTISCSFQSNDIYHINSWLSKRIVDKSKFFIKLFCPVHKEYFIFICKMRAFKPINYELESLFVSFRLLIFFRILREFIKLIF